MFCDLFLVSFICLTILSQWLTVSFSLDWSIVFKLSIVALHCCVSFCYMAKWISHMYTYVQTDAEAETPVLWPLDAESWLIGKDPDAGKDCGWDEKGMTEWDGWMVSLTRWTWVWVNSGSWWWTGRPGVLHFMGSQRVGHDWMTELNWTELNWWDPFLKGTDPNHEDLTLITKPPPKSPAS